MKTFNFLGIYEISFTECFLGVRKRIIIIANSLHSLGFSKYFFIFSSNILLITKKSRKVCIKLHLFPKIYYFLIFLRWKVKNQRRIPRNQITMNPHHLKKQKMMTSLRLQEIRTTLNRFRKDKESMPKNKSKFKFCSLELLIILSRPT